MKVESENRKLYAESSQLKELLCEEKEKLERKKETWENEKLEFQTALRDSGLAIKNLKDELSQKSYQEATHERARRDLEEKAEIASLELERARLKIDEL